MICVEGMMGKGIFPYKVRTKRKFASALVNEHCLSVKSENSKIFAC